MRYSEDSARTPLPLLLVRVDPTTGQELVYTLAPFNCRYVTTPVNSAITAGMCGPTEATYTETRSSHLKYSRREGIHGLARLVGRYADSERGTEA